jgi:hypothetical protein
MIPMRVKNLANFTQNDCCLVVVVVVVNWVLKDGFSVELNVK